MKTFKYIILMFVSLVLFNSETKAQNISLPTYLADTTAPTGAVLEYHNGLPISANNLVANPTSVDTGKYYIVYNYGGTCYSTPTQIRVLQPICPVKTVNIANYIDASNAPDGMIATIHSSLPVTDANRLPTGIQPAGKYYVAYKDLTLGCYSDPVLYIIKNNECTTPDNNATIVNLPISGNVSTNDSVSPGTVYGNPAVNPTNPSSCSPSIAANGTYTFVCSTAGKYEFNVPVCPPGQTTNCPTELLTINVLPLTNIPPVANPDIASTKQDVPVNINVRANDFTLNPGGSLDNPTITGQPKNGTASVNADGTVKYIPNPGFVGKDTIHYQVCDTTLHPAKCDNTIAIIDVLPTMPPNTTKAADDFATTKCTNPATGNALLNDTDPELNFQSTYSQTVTVADKGTFTLDGMGHFSFTPVFGYAGSINFPYKVYDNGNPNATNNATIYIIVEACDITEPDFNETWVNIPINGNLNTNDKVSPGSTYGTPTPSATNPSACAPAVASDGTYVFSCNVPGKYTYEVPVCPPGVSTNCPLQLLTITVLEKNSATNPPVANTDIATTKKDSAVTVNILSNDKTTNPNGKLGLPTITTPPSNGTAVINPDGTLKYTPNPNFIGIDTVHYQVCDTTLHPTKCDNAIAIITVLPPTAPNTTTAADDYNTTKQDTPVSGNVKTNDKDAEGNTQTITAQNTTLPQGTFVLNPDGTYTFTPKPGFYGPVDIPYTTCDNGTPVVCASATLHILVQPADVTKPDFNVTNVDVPVDGNVNTNDVVTPGTQYGTPVPVPGNPSSCTPTIATNGTYTFVCSTPGVYQYNVPVCPPGVSTNCPTQLLTITVLDPTTPNPPVANLDQAATKQDTPVNINVISNDNTPNLNGGLGTPSIITPPKNGTASVNPDGTIKYTPNPGFTGKDTLKYQVCDTSLSPQLCATAIAVIDVSPTAAKNTTAAADDYNAITDIDTAKGNVLLNDTDPEHNLQTVTPINSTLPQGHIVINADGTYTFTPTPGVTGPVDIVYTVCDNGTPQACAQATLHILVTEAVPDLTPVTTFFPTNFVGRGNFEAKVNIFELLGKSTTGQITILLTKNSKISVSFNPSMTMAGGSPVNNSIWTFDGTSSPIYYIFRTNEVINANDLISFGFSGVLTPGAADGKITISTIIDAGSGSEVNVANNIDADILTYFLK